MLLIFLFSFELEGMPLAYGGNGKGLPVIASAVGIPEELGKLH